MTLNLKINPRLLWLAILIVATLTRMPYVIWDDDIAAHPDERYLLGVAQDTPLFTNPARTSIHYAYGYLPLLIAQLVRLVSPASDPLLMLRLVAVLLSILTVAATIRLALTVGNWQTACIASVIITFAPLMLQHAHFYTVDLWATLFGVLALLATVKRKFALSGIIAGLALSSKISMLWAVVPLIFCLMIWAKTTRNRFTVAPLKNRALWRFTGTLVLIFVLTSPWYVIQPRLSWSGPYAQAWVVSGRFEVPFTMQYEYTLPWVYPIWQMALWGLGPLPTAFGLLAILKWGAFLKRQTFSVRVLLVSTFVYFVATGALFVKFPRYMLPVYPAWAVLAGTLLTLKTSKHFLARLRIFAGVVLIGMQVVTGLAQISMYRQPHPWTSASKWVYDTVPLSTQLMIEPYDHPLPVNTISADSYDQTVIPISGTDDDQMTLLRELKRTDDIFIISSRRNFAAQCHHDCDSEIMAWYRQMFSQRKVLLFTRCPHLFGIAVTDDPFRDADLPVAQSLAEMCGTRYAIRLPNLDESFRVYDSPSVAILLPKNAPCRD